MNKLLKYINFLRFQIGRFGGYSFDTDSLDFHSSNENEYFMNRLSIANQYLEFGAGASTLIAASKGITTVTVESDPLFMSAIADSLFRKKLDRSVTLIARPIGLLGPWGSPFVSFLSPITKKRARLFREYSEPPLFKGFQRTIKDKFETWNDGGVYLPDLILIDGKFRVACALKLLDFFLQYEHTDYEIIVDDYIGRKQYHVLDNFFEAKLKMNEFAIFSHKFNVCRQELTETISLYELVPD